MYFVRLCGLSLLNLESPELSRCSVPISGLTSWYLTCTVCVCVRIHTRIRIHANFPSK